jgi:site-specific DNA-methyltransferase (adenine-specific)/modification methylase
MREEIIGDCRLILGDCRDVLPTLGKFDAVISDPPYGIDIAKTGKVGGNGKAAVKDYGASDWDKSTPPQEIIDSIREMSSNQALFGGNYFALPPTPCWLVWDKMNTGNFADCELVWTNWKMPVRRIQWLWNGMIRQGGEERFHPTQKPVGVMEWVIGLCPKSETILDPFMGSGTTGVASANLGRKFTGIEREPKYFDIACKRIDDAYRQTRMFA